MESRFYVKYNMERAEFDRQYTVVQYRPNCTKMLVIILSKTRP